MRIPDIITQIGIALGLLVLNGILGVAILIVLEGIFGEEVILEFVQLLRNMS